MFSIVRSTYLKNLKKESYDLRHELDDKKFNADYKITATEKKLEEADIFKVGLRKIVQKLWNAESHRNPAIPEITFVGSVYCNYIPSDEDRLLEAFSDFADKYKDNFSTRLGYLQNTIEEKDAEILRLREVIACVSSRVIETIENESVKKDK